MYIHIPILLPDEFFRQWIEKSIVALMIARDNE